jgi:nucleoside-diphosphate-sugar epimerase
MRILITGHEGFIGRNMLAWCQNEEGWHVDGYEWHQHERPDVSGYDWVIHLGAITDESFSDVDAIMKQNLEFSQWLFHECNRHGVHLQYASTSDVYGHGKDFGELAPCHPQSPIAWSKYLFDRWVFQQPLSVFVQGFRYFNVYGRYQHLHAQRANESDVIARWRNEILTAGHITVPANAEHIRRDWVWVGDVCRLHIDFIKTVHGSGIWNVGSGLTHSMLDIAEELAELEEVEILTAGLSDRPHSGPSKICADLTHLKETIGKRKWLNLFEFLNQ